MFFFNVCKYKEIVRKVFFLLGSNNPGGGYLVVGGPRGPLDPLVGHQVEVPLSRMVQSLKKQKLTHHV